MKDTGIIMANDNTQKNREEIPTKNIAARVEALIAQTIMDMGYILWDVEFKKEGIDWNLTVFIDKPGGIWVNDCELVSKAIDPILDEADPIENSYYLQVFSSGLGRNLTKPAHFEKYIGQEILIKLIRPIQGEREFVGKLLSFDKTTVIIKNGEEEKAFNIKETAFIKANDINKI